MRAPSHPGGVRDSACDLRMGYFFGLRRDCTQTEMRPAARSALLPKGAETRKISGVKRVAKEEQFLTDAKGRRTGVVLDLATYEHLREAAEELADIQTYDALHDRVHSEIAAGQFESLTSYRKNRKRRAK
jgi:hypothetical protein